MLGAIPFAYLVGRLRGIDIRQHGSGNVGATNVMRVFGPATGVAVLVLDAGKGFLATWLGMASGETTGAICGLAAILGHTFTPFLKFRGGKGVATALGVLLTLVPKIALGCLAVFGLAVAVSGYVSVGSIFAAIGLPIFMFYWQQPPVYQIFAVIAAGFVIYRHIPNIKRLLAGQENPIRGKRT
ncbi:MAG: glycerol-3-phosphate 1-O-acyltransferase PlsY [Heliobacteriaceae bacterium]|nr:glycerol-3-phosphate 1-O-acyltransferase PlsY [Heliobacteriaceae bacterium]MDD4588529.1 glycerol-3-phosphate 1-O-acyltransferase PlsY [Heliobacteriaceae bacterium]